MKVLTQIQEIEKEGLLSLLGEKVTFFCMNYIYTGKLIGVNDTQIMLENPSIVYETGAFSDPKWKDAQPLPGKIYIRLSAVECYGIMK